MARTKWSQELIEVLDRDWFERIASAVVVPIQCQWCKIVALQCKVQHRDCNISALQRIF